MNPKATDIREILGTEIARIVAVNSGAFERTDWNQRILKGGGIVETRASKMSDYLEGLMVKLSEARIALGEHSLQEQEG